MACIENKLGAIFPMATVAEVECLQPKEEPGVDPSDFVPFWAGGMFDLWIGRHLSLQLESLSTQSGFNYRYTGILKGEQNPEYTTKVKAAAFSIHGLFDRLPGAHSLSVTERKGLSIKEMFKFICSPEMQEKAGTILPTVKFSSPEKHLCNRPFTVFRCFATLALLAMMTSCRTQPPSIFLHGSLEPRFWKTGPIYRVSQEVPDPSHPATKGITVEVIAAPDPLDSIGRIVEQTVYTETTTTNDIGKRLIATQEEKRVVDASVAKVALTGNDKIYRRKLNPGDVIYFLQGEHHNMAQSRFMPLEGDYRIPLRHIDKKYSELKDYEKLFLNFVIGTHLIFRNPDNFQTPHALLPEIAAYYESHKIDLWNVLVNNIYYQYSHPSGNTIVVNFNKMQEDLAKQTDPPRIPANFFSHHKSHIYPEAISRPNILSSEVRTWLSQTGTVYSALRNDLKNVLYYIDKNDPPFIFNLGAVELNGVRIDGSHIENISWNIFDWKHSGVKYIVKDIGDAETSMKKLKLKRGMITNKNDNKRYNLNIKYDRVVGLGILIRTTGEGFSRITRSREYRRGRTIDAGMQEIKLIKPDMIRTSNLKKHFQLK